MHFNFGVLEPYVEIGHVKRWSWTERNRKYVEDRVPWGESRGGQRHWDKTVCALTIHITMGAA